MALIAGEALTPERHFARLAVDLRVLMRMLSAGDGADKCARDLRQRRSIHLIRGVGGPSPIRTLSVVINLSAGVRRPGVPEYGMPLKVER